MTDAAPPPDPESAPPPAPAYQAPPPAPAYQAPAGQVPAVGADGLPLKSKMVAGLLGIFVGGLGIHNFYLGNTNKAIIQIVVTVFTCGLGSIWGLVEGILILTGSPSYSTDSDGRPLAQ